MKKFLSGRILPLLLSCAMSLTTIAGATVIDMSSVNSVSQSIFNDSREQAMKVVDNAI